MKSWVRFIFVTILSLGLVVGFKHNIQAQIAPSQLVRQAQQEYYAGKSERSLELLNRAEQIYQSQEEVLPQAQVLALASLVHQQQRHWNLARTSLDRSLALIAQIPDSTSKVKVLAQVKNSEGHYALAVGQNRSALANWQRAEQLYRQVDDASGVAGTVLSQAEALKQMGFHRRACDLTLALIEPTQPRCQDLAESNFVAIIEGAKQAEPWLTDCLTTIGSSLLSMGKLQDAELFINASRNTNNIGNFLPNTEAKITLNLGNLARAIAFQAKDREDLARFRQHYRQALRYFQQLEHQSSPSYRLAGQLNHLSLLIAEDKWLQAQQLANKITLPSEDRTHLFRKIKFANSLVKLQQRNLALKYDLQEIAQMYFDVINLAQLAGDSRAESSAWGNLGEIEPQLQLEYTRQQLYERALILAQANHAPEMAYRWQWRLGRVYRQQGLRVKAIASYQAALANLSSLRSDLVALEKEVRYEFKEQIEPVYRELADLLLAGNPSDEDLAAARNTIEALQVAELDNYFQDACLTFEPKSIASIDADAALIYTIILPERLEIILAHGDASGREIFHHYSTAIAQERLETTIRQLRLYLTEPDRKRDVEALSEQIYSWLLQPLMANLASQQPKTLVFVLDGLLQTVPMSALYDGERYLIEQYAIALTPGLRLLNTQQDSRPLSFLAGGISRYLQIDDRHFAALQNIPAELETASQQEYPALLNQKFTPDNLLAQLDRTSASVVHLATHGQFRANPQQTFLLMWQKLLTIDEFSSILQNRVKAQRLPIKLLVLSACDTATGDRRATLGLAGIAVRSGALSTIATLWQINDESTTELMKHFYRHLKTHSKAEALRLAQLELWKAQNRDWQVPAFWSAYVVIGNWQ